MSRDVNLWPQSCLDCQQSKIQTHIRSPIQPIPVPGRRFYHLHVDLVGPLPQYSGFNFLFTIVDRTSRWLEAIPLQSTTAEECAKVLLRSWIPTFRVPSVITSNRGAQFTSSGLISASSCGLFTHQPCPSTHSLMAWLRDSIAVSRYP